MTERARYWRRQLDRWERSGLSEVAYCRRGGINAVTFAWWKRKLGATAGRMLEKAETILPPAGIRAETRHPVPPGRGQSL